MRCLLAVAALAAASPALALSQAEGSISIRNPGGATFAVQPIDNFGQYQVNAADGGFVKATISAIDGGTIKMTALSYNSTFSFASVLYNISVSGPEGGYVPMTISTKGSLFLQGQMTGYVQIGINWADFIPGVGEVSHNAFSMERSLCLGNAQCQFDPDLGSNWNLNNVAFDLLPNKIYTVALNVGLIQFGPPPDINNAGFGFGNAFIDPVINLAPAAVGYTFNSNLSGPNIPVAPGVPEPASWAMLVLGFGLAGSMARRRRSRNSLIPAE